MKNTTLRLSMPGTAMRIDFMREYMGVAAANELLRRAMIGEPGLFYAQENGLTFGTPDTRATSVLCWDEADRAYRKDPQWMVDATEFALTLGIDVETVDDQDHEEARERAVTLRKILAKAKYA